MIQLLIRIIKNNYDGGKDKVKDDNEEEKRFKEEHHDESRVEVGNKNDKINKNRIMLMIVMIKNVEVNNNKDDEAKRIDDNNDKEEKHDKKQHNNDYVKNRKVENDDAKNNSDVDNHDAKDNKEVELSFLQHHYAVKITKVDK